VGDTGSENDRRLKMRDKTEQIEVQSVLEIDAGNVPYRELNTRLRNAVVGGTQKMVIRNVHGQRYIGTNLGRSRLRYVAVRAMTLALSWTAPGSLFMGMRRMVAGML
jgi:hypothetical protein